MSALAKLAQEQIELAKTHLSAAEATTHPMLRRRMLGEAVAAADWSRIAKPSQEAEDLFHRAVSLMHR